MDARKRGENEAAWAPREAVVDVLTGAAAYIRAGVHGMLFCSLSWPAMS